MFYPQCTVCYQEFNDNISFMDHLFTHAIPPPEGAADDATVTQCVYCIERFPNAEELQTHLKHNHPADTKSPDLYTYACLICEVSFTLSLFIAC